MFSIKDSYSHRIADYVWKVNMEVRQLYFRSNPDPYSLTNVAQQLMTIVIIAITTINDIYNKGPFLARADSVFQTLTTPTTSRTHTGAKDTFGSSICNLLISNTCARTRPRARTHRHTHARARTHTHTQSHG